MIFQGLLEAEISRLQALLDEKTTNEHTLFAQLSISQAQQFKQEIESLNQKIVRLEGQIISVNAFSRAIVEPGNRALQKELVQQFKRIFIRMLLDETLFRFRCYVEKSRKWWWRFWSHSPASRLAFYERQINTEISLLGLEAYLQSIPEMLHRLDSQNNREFNHTILSLSITAKSFSFDQVEVKPVLTDAVLSARYADLKFFFAQQVAHLGEQFEQKNHAERKINGLDFHQISGYSSMSDSDKRKYEKLLLAAHYPLILAKFVEQAEEGNVELAYAEESTRQAQFFIGMNNALQDNILDTLGRLYEFPRSASVGPMIYPIVLLEHVRANASWSFFDLSEYQAVERILSAAGQSIQAIDYFATERYIARLAQCKKITTTTFPQNALINVMRIAFSSARGEITFSHLGKEFFKPGPAQKKFKDSLARQERAILEYETAIRAAHPSQAISGTGIQASNLPKGLQQIQAFVYFIFCSNSNEIFNIPIHWTVEGGLTIVQHGRLSDAFLQKTVALVEISESLYFSVLMIGVLLMCEGVDGENYVLLQQVLQDLLGDRYDRETFGKLHAGLSANHFFWPLSYFVSDKITVPQENLTVKTAKTALLNMFSMMSSPDNLEITSERSRSRASFGSSFSAPSLTDRFFGRRSGSERKSLENSSIATQEEFIAFAETSAKTILSKKEDWVAMREVARRLYSSNVRNKESLLLMALLQWYEGRRGYDAEAIERPGQREFIGCFAKLKEKLQFSFFNSEVEFLDDILNCKVTGSARLLQAKIKQYFSHLSAGHARFSFDAACGSKISGRRDSMCSLLEDEEEDFKLPSIPSYYTQVAQDNQDSQSSPVVVARSNSFSSMIAPRMLFRVFRNLSFSAPPSVNEVKKQVLESVIAIGGYLTEAQVFHLNKQIQGTYYAVNYKKAFDSSRYPPEHLSAFLLHCVLKWCADRYPTGEITRQYAALKTWVHYYLLEGWEYQLPEDLEVEIGERHAEFPEAACDALNLIIEERFPGRVLKFKAAAIAAI